MSQREDEELGNLDVTINYIRVAQDIKAAIYFLQKLRDELDVAAIKRGIISRDRRNSDRRKLDTGGIG